MRFVQWLLRFVLLAGVIVSADAFVLAQPASSSSAQLSKEVLQYVRVRSPKIVLTHVRVIDGTGRAAFEDQNVVIEDGKISAIQRAQMSLRPKIPRCLICAGTR